MHKTRLYHPEQDESRSRPFWIQLLEVTENHLLIRLRGGLVAPEGDRRIRKPEESPFADLALVLSDSAGRAVAPVEGHEGGAPFAGLYDVAFPFRHDLDLDGELTLTSRSETVRFRLHPAEEKERGDPSPGPIPA